MKKVFKFVLLVILIALLTCVAYKFLCKKNTNSSLSTIKYYSYENDGKFIMSSTAHKVEDVKQIENDYYIKEHITNVKSEEKIVEVLYNDFSEEPYLYGYYTEKDFNKYFSDQIKDGLVCDNKTEIAFGEGTNIKCLIHKEGFEYEKIDSELCVLINGKEICLKPNAWSNIDKHKEEFENAGWICEYQDYDTGKWTNDKKPTNGILECSKVKPSEGVVKEGNLYCYIGPKGWASCDNNKGWCNINNDLTTNCNGID